MCHIRRRICIDFVTSESGCALIGCVHLQSSELIERGHGSSRRTAGGPGLTPSLVEFYVHHRARGYTEQWLLGNAAVMAMLSWEASVLVDICHICCLKLVDRVRRGRSE